MFRPVKMALVHIYALRRELPRVTTALMEAGVLHLERAERFAGKLPGLRSAEPAGQIAQMDRLTEELQELARKLGVPWAYGPMSSSCPHLDPENIVNEGKKRIGELMGRADTVLRDVEEEGSGIENLELLSTQVQSLEELGLRGELLKEPVFIEFQVGTVPVSNLTALRRSLESVPVHMEVSRRVAKDALVNIVTTKNHGEELRAALRGANFSRLRMPPRYAESENAAEEIEVELWERRERLSLLRAELGKAREELKEEVWDWKRTLEANRKVLIAMESFLQTDYAYYITGWVPVNRLEGLRKQLCTGKGCGTEMDYAVAEDVLAKHDVDVPTKLSHPIWMKPFEQLVNIYGWPRYEGIDPTPFLMLTFVPMFGMMFGDVGHGFSLALIGAAMLLARRWLERLADLGGMLLWCGLAGMVFGVLYGSVFGLESVLPTIWMKPLDKPEGLLKVGVMIGMACVTLGILLNVVQAARRRNWHDTFFGQWGLLSVILYWTLIPIVWTVLTGGRLPFGLKVTALLVLWPLAGIVAGGKLTEKLGKRKHEEEEGMLELISKPAEVMLGLLTNTVSFVRVAAFGLSHAAMLSAVYVTADAMEKAFAGVPGVRENVIVEGNIGVFALEGLVVFIQCMRLEYYEFFSKFFLDQGRRYEPLCLPR